MIPQRRRGYFLLAGLTVFLLLLHFKGRELYATPPFELVTGHEALSKTEDGSTQDNVVNEATVERVSAPQSSLSKADRQPWDQLKERFPVQDFIRLPAGKPSQLPKVQYSFPAESEEAKKVRLHRKTAVKKAFERCWSSYRKSAWKQDELMPISGRGNDWFGGWAATLIDSLDTLWIMDMKTEFAEATEAAARVDFSPGTSTQEVVNVFETNIRHLGGLLGAYDLSGDMQLLEKATEVGNMLYAAFDTPNRMPITRWKPEEASKGKPQHADDAILAAELGSFGLEFTRLTQLTGDPKFFDAAQRITNKLHQAQSKTRLPGMFNLVFNGKDMVFDQGGTFKLGAMIDSL
jgi:mannosyl-oligosaccharide alpha-1,2-mannosidase